MKKKKKVWHIQIHKIILVILINIKEHINYTIFLNKSEER